MMQPMFTSDFHRKKHFGPGGSYNNNNSNAEKIASAAAAAAAPRDIAATKDETKDSEIVEMRPEHLFKHPLQNKWTLWYLESDRSKAWEELQNEITSFDTVEDFWSLYNHIKPPSEIKIGSDYSLFKKGIRPMWEDSANKQGGRWMISLSRGHKPSDMDNLWLDVLLCLIGEAFDHSDQICGAVINLRGKGHKIAIWTADGNNEEATLEIGHKLKDSLRLSKSTLQYQLHKDTMVKQGPSVKPRFTL
ncbi:eukaryotic translation initiation factor 4E1 isoform X3 [Episyrphus balteatus]|nr:eukaryotic translation initiation factor 4E1 isoform X3 [Episyrphus balteatus]